MATPDEILAGIVQSLGQLDTLLKALHRTAAPLADSLSDPAAIDAGMKGAIERDGERVAAAMDRVIVQAVESFAELKRAANAIWACSTPPAGKPDGAL